MVAGGGRSVSCAVRVAMVLDPEPTLNCWAGPLGSEGQVGREVGPETLQLHCPVPSTVLPACTLHGTWWCMKRVPARFFESDGGRIPVREWLLSLSDGDRNNIGDDIRVA